MCCSCCRASASVFPSEMAINSADSSMKPMPAGTPNPAHSDQAVQELHVQATQVEALQACFRVLVDFKSELSVVGECIDAICQLSPAISMVPEAVFYNESLDTGIVPALCWLLDRHPTFIPVARAIICLLHSIRNPSGFRRRKEPPSSSVLILRDLESQVPIVAGQQPGLAKPIVAGDMSGDGSRADSPADGNVDTGKPIEEHCVCKEGNPTKGTKLAAANPVQQISPRLFESKDLEWSSILELIGTKHGMVANLLKATQLAAQSNRAVVLQLHLHSLAVLLTDCPSNLRTSAHSEPSLGSIVKLVDDKQQSKPFRTTVRIPGDLRRAEDSLRSSATDLEE